MLRWAPLPLLLLLLLPPTWFLFVPKSWGHLPLVLFVKYMQEIQKEHGELPDCLAPGREVAWGLTTGMDGLSRDTQVWLPSINRHGGTALSRLPCRSPGTAVKVAGREAHRDNGVLVSQTGNLWPLTPSPYQKKNLSPAMARPEQLLACQ